MFNTADVVLHIGLLKTGSTYLQKSFFPFLDLNFIYYSYNSFPFFNIVNDGVNLISSESFAGIAYKSKGSLKRYDILENLHSLLPRSRVILCLRDKNSLVKSLYKMFVLKGGILSFDDFVHYELNSDYLDVEELVDFVNSRFRDCFIYDYEDFCRDGDRVLGDMCEFIGVPMIYGYSDKPVNVGLNDNMVSKVRNVNRNLGKVFPSDYRMYFGCFCFDYLKFLRCFKRS